MFLVRNKYNKNITVKGLTQKMFIPVSRIGVVGSYTQKAGVGGVRAKIRRSAARGLGNIEAVMASPPTYSQGATAATSTIVPGASTGFGGGRFETGNGSVTESVGGIILDPTSLNQYRPWAMISGTASSTTRRGCKGTKLIFDTDGPAFDIAMNTAGGNVCLYVTDLATGIRARASANDQPTAAGTSYHKWDFGSSAARRLELYVPVGTILRSMNVAVPYTITKPVYDDPVRAAVIWDSYGEGIESGGTNALTLTVTDYLAARLGITFLSSLSRGGTGHINQATNLGNYGYRIDNGDIDPARIGVLDFVLIPGSVNDAAQSEAAVQAAVTANVQKAMAQQPTALIFGCGPEACPNTPAVQSRFDAMRAGFLAAANSDSRCIWLDSSPSGENWINPSNFAAYIGPDGTHVNDAGSVYLGGRMGQSILDAIAA